MENKSNTLVIMKSTLGRLPVYYCYLQEKMRQGERFVSSTTIAQSLSLNPVLVRKDLAGVASSPGRPKLGFEILPLMEDMKRFLGYDNVTEAVLVGVGGLGRTLLHYQGFDNYGLSIVAGFDSDVALHGLRISGKPVLPIENLDAFVKRVRINIGIIAVPSSAAQEVCNALVAAGVKAIWNFAPTHIDVPQGILVKNENLAASLAALSHELSSRF
ncbi:MAG: redox-sensing transcriptional repressor Rex [Bacteroidales bacterium]|jgi:redox-sensing transcriptional repressor|nr:redox-sensing transcriptional repressor Rex [Bacteroidales bacterium]